MAIEVIRDEQDKKREYARYLTRSRKGDRTEIANPDPRYRYKLANSKPRGQARAKSQGFEIVPTDDPAQLVHGEKRDGAQYLGEDAVLMREPIELYEMKREDQNDQLQRLMRSGNEQAREEINKIARDAGVAPAHKDITFDNSGEGEPVEFRVRNDRK